MVQLVGSQRCQPRELLCPRKRRRNLSISFVTRHGTIRVVGAGHSFSGLVPTERNTSQLTTSVAFDELTTTGLQRAVRVLPFTILGEPLYERGFGLTNQGDVDAQTLAGACSTGTHGTGPEFGCLANDVSGSDGHGGWRNFDSATISQTRTSFMPAECVWGHSALCRKLRFIAVQGIRWSNDWKRWALDDCLDRSEQLASSNRHFEFFHFPVRRSSAGQNHEYGRGSGTSIDR